VVGLRQERALERSAAAAAEAERLMRAESPALEIVAEEVRNATNALGEITGERVGSDLLDVIFSEFCIGK
jgi:tRNA modification GTPase